MKVLNHVYICFIGLSAKFIISENTTYFFRNRKAHTGLLLKYSKIPQFKNKVSLPFQSHMHNNRWKKYGCVNVLSHRTKYCG